VAVAGVAVEDSAAASEDLVGAGPAAAAAARVGKLFKVSD
jgi:hypothetical protein